MANRISTILDLDSQGFGNSLKGIRTSVGQADGVLGKFKAGAKASFDGLKQYAAEGALAAGAALVAFSIKAAHAFTDTAKAALDLSMSTGLSKEEASRWIGVADDYKVTAQDLAIGLGRVAKTIDDTKWAKYGIETRDAAGHARSANDILLDSFDMLSGIENGTQRAAVGVELFSKGYRSLTPILGHTRSEYEAMLGTVEKGQVITEAEAVKAEKMRLAEDKLKDALHDVTLAWGQVVSGLSPVIERTAKTVTVLSDLAEKADRATGSIGGLGTVLAVVGGNPATAFIDAVEAASGAIDTNSMSLQELTKFMDGHGISVDRQVKILNEWHKANDVVEGSTTDLTDAIRGEEQAAKDLAAGEEIAAAAEKGHEQAAKDLETGVDNLTKAIIDEFDAQREATKATIDLAQAQLDAVGTSGDYEQSIRDLDTAYYELQTQMMENATTQKDGEVADRDKEQSSRDLASAEHDAAAEIYNVAQKYSEQTGAVAGSKEQADRMRDSLELAKAKYPELRDEINRYIDALMRIPGAVFTEVNLRSSQTGGPRIALAEGGIVRASPGGTDVTIGEGGHDEAVIPLDGRHVTAAPAAPAAPLIENFHVHVMGSADQVTRDLAKFVRRNGPGPLRQLLGIN